MRIPSTDRYVQGYSWVTSQPSKTLADRGYWSAMLSKGIAAPPLQVNSDNGSFVTKPCWVRVLFIHTGLLESMEFLQTLTSISIFSTVQLNKSRAASIQSPTISSLVNYVTTCTVSHTRGSETINVVQSHNDGYINSFMADPNLTWAIEQSHISVEAVNVKWA